MTTLRAKLGRHRPGHWQRHFTRDIDALGYIEQTSQTPTPAPGPSPTDAGSATAGAAPPPGMLGSPVVQYETEGARFSFWSYFRDGKLAIYKKDNVTGTQPVLMQTFDATGDNYYWSDVTATHFRLWKLVRTRQQPSTSTTSTASAADSQRPGIAAGRQAANHAAATRDRIRDISRKANELWKRGN